MKSVWRGLLVAAAAISSLFAFAAPADAEIYCKDHEVELGGGPLALVTICVDDTAQNWHVRATSGGGTGASISKTTDEGEVVTYRVCVLNYPWRDGPRTVCKDVGLNQ